MSFYTISLSLHKVESLGKCHLHLGSNIGDRKVQIARSLLMIEETIGPIVSSSSFYETEAWGNTDQGDFINMAIEVEHYMTPLQLLNAIHTIERNIGRERKIKWEPRKIDIDIIFMEDIVMDTKDLTVPHKWMEKRNFVLFPLAEIAGSFGHPTLNKTVSQLLEECTDSSSIKKLESEYI